MPSSFGGKAGSDPLPPPPTRPGTDGGCVSLEGSGGTSLVCGPLFKSVRLNSVFLLCGNFGDASSLSGSVGNGCCALFCLGDMDPVTSDILRVTLELPLLSPLPPGVAGKGRPCMVSDLDGSFGLFPPI